MPFNHWSIFTLISLIRCSYKQGGRERVWAPVRQAFCYPSKDGLADRLKIKTYTTHAGLGPPPDCRVSVNLPASLQYRRHCLWEGKRAKPGKLPTRKWSSVDQKWTFTYSSTGWEVTTDLWPLLDTSHSQSPSSLLRSIDTVLVLSRRHARVRQNIQQTWKLNTNFSLPFCPSHSQSNDRHICIAIRPAGLTIPSVKCRLPAARQKPREPSGPYAARLNPSLPALISFVSSHLMAMQMALL